MRSSIACARCRRSKVKCVNNGVGTTCRACETTGRECTYPVPLAGQAGAPRRESNETRQHGDVMHPQDPPRKPRVKKTPTPTGVSTKESMRALVDALDPSILTPQVWVELFDIWTLHYSTDLPFIHPPSFLRSLRQIDRIALSSDFSSQHAATSPFPAASSLTLLAFLALTARFHDKLVAHHSPPSATRPSNPLIACQYYAAACKARLAGNSGDGLGMPDLDRVQALAMLALHDWGNCAGQKAWVGLGVSIRYAQVLGLQYQQDLDDEPQSRSTMLRQSGPIDASNGNFVEDETKRRIFWGLFIMDRYLSSGKFRPQMLRSEEIRIQLPSSERSYMFKEKVRTSLLVGASIDLDQRNSAHRRQTSSPHHGSPGRAEDEARLGRWEVGADEGIVSRYIKAIDLYGSIIRWSCSGGRRQEKYAPWESASTWNILNVKLNHLIDHLPRDLTLSPTNTHAHIINKTSTPFLMMHSVFLLGRMMLHREYIPFIPLRCSKPEGPLDPPLFPPDQYRIPQGFWEYSAAELFKSSRALIDLVYTCHEWKVLPQTPIVGFAIYVAANTGVYAINFPWMDPNGFMCKKATSQTPQSDDDSGSNASRHALSLLALMKRRLKMADGWFKTINRMHRYYVRIKKDFHRNVRGAGSPSAPPGPLSIREGGVGGGLEEFKMIEATLKEFGSLEDEDVEMSDALEPQTSRGESSVDGASTGMKSEQHNNPQETPIRFDAWKAVNSGTPIQPSAGNSGPLPSIASTTAPAFRPFNAGGAYASPQTLPPLAPNQFPPYAPQQGPNPATQASMSLQNQLNPMTSAAPLTMTAEETDAWLKSLDTAFTSDDVSAFVEGIDWQAWAQDPMTDPQANSWLNTIWMS